MSGTLFLVGVGPGDPELLTLKAARVIAASPVVAYPTTGDRDGLARDIASAHIGPDAIHLPIGIPMTPERAPARAVYDAAAAEILAHLRSGRDVSWLCEGDPLFYGSAMFLLGRLADMAPVEIIPGVTSLTAAAAVCARPLAARNDILTVLPAPLPDRTLRAELGRAHSVALIKVGRHFDRMRSLLEETGRADDAVVIEHATTARQRVTALRGLAHDQRPYFSTILSYRGAENWP